MKSHILNRIALLSFLAAMFCSVFERPAVADQSCPLALPASPSNTLTSYITIYPYFSLTNSLGVQQQLVSYFIIDVTNKVKGSNYSNPPIPYGLYPAWCIDEWDDISPTYYTVPGSTVYTGSLYSTCDPNLNSELPPGHTNTLVSSTNWQMINYILNHQTVNGTNYFWWDVQAAINTLIGSGVGSIGYCGYVLTTPIPDGAFPDGSCGYATYHPQTVQTILTAASNNAPTWIPQCGDVYGVVYVTQPDSDQFLLIEVPIPCSPCIGVTKQVACLLPGNNCGAFGSVAEGFLGANCAGAPDGPAFCYEISITNCGTLPLTNVTVKDNLLGDLTANFFPSPATVFEPGASASAYFSMSFTASATNTVVAQGQAALSGSVTNESEVITNGYPVASTASAVALVAPASISCSLSLTSPFVSPTNNGGSTLILPETLPGQPAVMVSITVSNSGASALNNVTISVPASIQGLTCQAPSPFSLPVGASQTFQLCSNIVTCPVNQSFDISVTGTVNSDADHCGVYDLTGSAISVCCSSLGIVECSTNGGCDVPNQLSGAVVLDCVAGSTSLAGDTGLSGWTVSLYGSSGPIGSPLLTTTTDSNGNYSFSNLGGGSYTVVVAPPAGYVETYPLGVTNSQQQVSVVACQNTTGIFFGYANTTPPVISVAPGQNLACNPASLPSDDSIASTVTAVVSCGASNISVTHSDTNTSCLYTRTYLITVSDTYGNIAATNVVYSWMSNSTPLVITGAPTNSNLGCNPASLPTDDTVTNGVSAANACGSAPLAVTNSLATNGCLVTDTFVISAADACGNTGSSTVVYTWTANQSPLVITGAPTSSYLGCNPASLPTASSVISGVSAANACGSAPLTVTNTLATNGCLVSDTFLISAVDACGNTGSSTVVYTWTVNQSPLVITGAPTNSNLGCNPSSLPTADTVTNGVSAANACGSAPLTVTNSLATNGCLVTDTFVISAVDACGNIGSSTVVYTWTANQSPLVITGAPTNSYLGCNPASLPTSSSVISGVSAANACGSAPLTVTNTLATNGCLVTDTFVISAVDACGNIGSSTVVYTWTANQSPLVITGTPTNSNLGCNPASLPTASTVTNGVSAANACGSAPLTVTNTLATNGCLVTDTFVISAADACGNTGSSTVVYTWTANQSPLVITGAPTNSNLGCNPASLPTCKSVTNGVSAANTCGSAPLTVTSTLATNGCLVTDTFVISAVDACGNTGSSTVVYSWTANTTAPVIHGAPTNSYLGCNPSSLPTASSVTNGVSATAACGGATISVSGILTTNGCFVTNTFTIKAADSCGNTASTSVAYGWMKNTTLPTISGVPTNAFLGCNASANLPSDATIASQIKAAAACGTAAIGVSHVDATNGCSGTRVFTITATDGCGNTATASVTYSWSVNSVGPTITCPSNVTVVTNFCQMYCTFPPCDWSGSCDNGIFYNNWWQNWCWQNPSSQSWPSFTNWWNSCGGNNSQYTNWWNSWNTNHPTNWWGCWSGSQSGTWWSSWNYFNRGSQYWMPCSGNNPDTILSGFFNKVYSNGCVYVGLSNGNCATFSSCAAAQTCLNWGGSPGVLAGRATNPATCGAGSFCAQVLALRLNCDFSDYGCAPGFVGKCGDLVLCDSTSPCNGQKVRDILGICNRALGGGSCPQGCTVPYLCGLCSNINQCFRGCQVSSWCGNHLCSVYIPTPAQTGTPVISDACSPNPTLTYTDNVTSGGCAATYVINRQWLAVDACGNSNTCTQVITVAQTNSCGLSGLVVLACSGDANLSNNEGFTNVSVTLENSQGAPISTTTTDANGNYSFGGNLAPGNYIVVVTPPGGYTETYPVGANNQIAVALSACQIQSAVNFAYIGSTPAVQLIKTAPSKLPCSGVITYTFAVTNTGNTCESLSVVDPLLGGTIFSQTSVAPGQGFLFASNYTVGTKVCVLTNTAWAIGTAPNGKSATNTSTVTTTITTKCVTNTICGNFNSQNPGGGYVWFNGHISCNPGKACTVYCQNATVTLSCTDGKTYTFPVPDCQINFSAGCSTGSSSFNGKSWATTLPCAGDDEIFLSGCGIPWQSDFANCKSVCWTGTFSCDTSGIGCNWQWSGACYNLNLSNCGSVSVKPCHNTPCGYSTGDHAGTPENCKSYCQGGACGGGGGNYTGSWSGTGSFTCK